MATIREEWKNKAARVLLVSVVMGIVLVVGFIVEMILSKGALEEILEEFGADLLGGRGGGSEKIKLFLIVSGLLLLTMMVTQFIYAQRIRQFAAIQPDNDEQTLMTRASTGGYIQLAAMILLVLVPFTLDYGYLPLLLMLAAWVTAIVGTVKMKNAFRNFRTSDMLNDTGKQGCENLRYTSVCQLRLLIMPIVYVVFMGLMVLILKDSVQVSWGGAEFDATSHDRLGRSLNDFGEMADNALTFVQILYYIYIIVMYILVFFTILWGLFALVKPVMGWNRMMNGLALREGETEEDINADDNAIAALLQKAPQWLWGVLAAVLATLLMLPMLPGKDKNSSSEEEIEPETEYDITEADNNESESNTKKKKVFPEGQVTEYQILVNDETSSDDYCNGMIYATKGGEQVYTGINIPSSLYGIEDQHDYDGDGNMDAMISWAYSAMERGQQFIVYYNFLTGQFEQIDDLDMDLKPEQIDNHWTFRLDQGITKVRYALIPGQFIMIADESIKAGETIRSFTVNDIFGNIGCVDYEEETYQYDLNDDGKKETLTFSRNPYLPGRYGSNLFLERIKYDGREITFIENASESHADGGVINILSSTSQGWHDIMIESEGGTFVYRWNGKNYEELK